MEKIQGEYFFEIKRGEKSPKDKIVIDNESSGRALLAIDLKEPWSCHQVYKIFDEKYAEIFGRQEVQEVNASRIIHVMKIMGAIEERLDGIKFKPLAYYALTKYFLASVLSTILRGDKKSVRNYAEPRQNSCWT